MRQVLLTSVFITLAFAVHLRAQMFVVDSSNGPGTNFTSIAATSAVAPDGAVLRVRAGVYTPFAIGGAAPQTQPPIKQGAPDSRSPQASTQELHSRPAE